MNKNVTLIILSLFSAGCLFAQNLRVVQGRVTNVDGEPLPGAVISIKNCDYSTTSDENGNFQLKSPYGYNHITASKDGYWPYTQEIDGSFLLFKLKYEGSSSNKQEEAYDNTYIPGKQKSISDSSDRILTWKEEYKDIAAQIKLVKEEIESYEQQYELMKDRYNSKDPDSDKISDRLDFVQSFIITKKKQLSKLEKESADLKSKINSCR